MKMENSIIAKQSFIEIYVIWLITSDRVYIDYID